MTLRSPLRSLPLRPLAALAALAALTLPSSRAVRAQAASTPPDDAAALMDKVFHRASWQDMTAKVRLTLRDKRGDTRTRELQMWSKKNAQGESRMLMRFLAPADVRGMGFLLIEHEDGPDDRRLFLAAMRRVKRISASGSGGNFMSSDFTYYDIGRPKLTDWRFHLDGQRDVSFEGKPVPCAVVVGEAATAQVKHDTGYSKVVWFVDRARLVTLAADYFDTDGVLFKHLDVLALQDVNGVPFATHMRATDKTTGHQSEMRFEDLKTDQGVADSTFTERALRRGVR